MTLEVRRTGGEAAGSRTGDAAEAGATMTTTGVGAAAMVGWASERKDRLRMREAGPVGPYSDL